MRFIWSAERYDKTVNSLLAGDELAADLEGFESHEPVFVEPMASTLEAVAMKSSERRSIACREKRGRTAKRHKSLCA